MPLDGLGEQYKQINIYFINTENQSCNTELLTGFATASMAGIITEAARISLSRAHMALQQIHAKITDDARMFATYDLTLTTEIL